MMSGADAVLSQVSVMKSRFGRGHAGGPKFLFGKRAGVEEKTCKGGVNVVCGVVLWGVVVCMWWGPEGACGGMHWRSEVAGWGECRRSCEGLSGCVRVQWLCVWLGWGMGHGLEGAQEEIRWFREGEVQEKEAQIRHLRCKWGQPGCRARAGGRDSW